MKRLMCTRKYQFFSFRTITNKKKELMGPQFGQLSTEISEITQIDKTHLNKQNGSFLTISEEFWAKKYQFLSFRAITKKEKKEVGKKTGDAMMMTGNSLRLINSQ